MSKINLKQYRTIVFDCDGVILNSNHVKTQAFYDVASVYGRNVAQALKDYHVLHGGISRYEKFQYLLKNILNKSYSQRELNTLLLDFSKKVKNALLVCEVANGIEELKKQTRNSKWLVVSGGDQCELREVFKERGLDVYFDGGIFGSPDDKNTILNRERSSKNITNKSLFLGDSMYDYEVASRQGMDFIFLSGWTEVLDFGEKPFLNVHENLSSLLQ